ncbi:MAG TPA: ATP-dependent helicase C-terminal domain-containing protein, partial [Thermoanaerobaculia bacterium]|nr:ATP-dependent helicase C-terminal domain-containing protein [Thermoanaerobaculia bacterium]
GSGKTTRIPPALTTLGRTILLQPRRVAARALARRIASERGWTIGDEIGWHIRFERRFSQRTNLLVATEGILTARMQSDPLLSEFNVVVLDEFHERSIHADLALALAKQAAASRDDLALVVMSATLDTEPLAEFLGARVIAIDSRTFPIEVRYAPGVTVASAVRETLATAKGHILCFLPGAREIERTIGELRGVDARVLPLHGSLDVDAQEAALAPSADRKVIVATNVAETSLTVDGVTDVIDSGLHKVLRYDSETAVDHLVTEHITGDSAEQRAGRAGRLAPGRATRLWDARMLLRPHRDPEIRRVDLASPALDIIAWGGDPETFEWFERPQEDRIRHAMQLLEELGAIEGRKLTPIGRQMRELPLHPRLARVVIAAHGAHDAIALAAESEQRELTPIVRRLLGHDYRRDIDDESFRKAILAGYPDRVAMRRESQQEKVLLATGTGATLAREIEHTLGDFFVAMEVRGDLVLKVVPIEREWLPVTRTEQIEKRDGDTIRIIERRCYMNIVLHETQVGSRKVARPQKPEARTLKLASGRNVKLEFRDDGSIHASVKLQELFGLADTPTVDGTPVTFALLAPNGRPVQVTNDLRSFWNGAYKEVRKELRGRYPKHPWPEDPWSATPTHRTKTKMRK